MVEHMLIKSKALGSTTNTDKKKKGCQIQFPAPPFPTHAYRPGLKLSIFSEISPLLKVDVHAFSQN